MPSFFMITDVFAMATTVGAYQQQTLAIDAFDELPNLPSSCRCYLCRVPHPTFWYAWDIITSYFTRSFRDGIKHALHCVLALDSFGHAFMSCGHIKYSAILSDVLMRLRVMRII
ncbi:hypothetical protein BD769DRAFT_1409142 [Suillus cothurnatus]|nr:hypothetical protein BD769DRAFT_1409142 [Suillus cothurnatus]